MLELLQGLDWPGAVALLGTIITIVTGFVGMIVMFYKRERPAKIEDPTEQHEKLHSRISDIKDHVATNEGDIKELRASVRSLQKQIADHEQRDIQDFKLVEAKMDRLMDIVVRILQDDKL